MLSLELRIDRARRFLRMLENDRPFLEARLLPLTADRQKRAKTYAATLMQQTRAEIARMLQEVSAQESHLAGRWAPRAVALPAMQFGGGR